MSKQPRCLGLGGSNSQEAWVMLSKSLQTLRSPGFVATRSVSPTRCAVTIGMVRSGAVLVRFVIRDGVSIAARRQWPRKQYVLALRHVLCCRSQNADSQLCYRQPAHLCRTAHTYVGGSRATDCDAYRCNGRYRHPHPLSRRCRSKRRAFRRSHTGHGAILAPKWKARAERHGNDG